MLKNIFVFMFILLFSCGNNNPLIGKWQSDTFGGISWEFSDNNVKMNLGDYLITGKYKLSGNKIIVDVDGDIKNYIYSIDGDKLEILEQDNDFTWVFYRTGESKNVNNKDKEIKESKTKISSIKNIDKKDIIATSSLPNDQYGNYEANNIIDKDLKTSWVEGKKDAGAGEWIMIKADKKVGTLKIANGYQEKESSYSDNNRVKSAKVLLITESMISTSSIDEIAEQIDDLLTNDMISWEIVELQDKIGYQEIKLSNRGLCKYLVFQIVDIYKGTKYNDTCISEIEMME